jgi:hypothetical protein
MGGGQLDVVHSSAEAAVSGSAATQMHVLMNKTLHNLLFIVRLRQLCTAHRIWAMVSATLCQLDETGLRHPFCL